MRVSLRAKQTAAVTFLIAVAMTVLSVQHLANLARVGLEDSLFLERGQLAASNADQVLKIRRILKEMGSRC